jgi:hypothetical protein
MTPQEALDILRRGATRRHGVLWGLTGGGHGEPGGVPVIERACSCVQHSLTKVSGLDETQPCDCGARDWNAKVEAALNALQATLAKVEELYEGALETKCKCKTPFLGDCPHCDLVIAARELLHPDRSYLNPDGN